MDAASFDLAKKEEIKLIIREIHIDCLLPAFLALRKIDQPDTDEGLAENFKNYDDLYRCLVRGYKDRAQAAAEATGYDIGFLFQKDEEFQKGCEEFAHKYAELPKFGDWLRRVRSSTDKLIAIRNNFLEQQNYPRNEFMDYYKSEVAQNFFDSTWQTAEGMLAVLISKHFPPYVRLHIIPEEERNPALPKKFGISYAPNRGTNGN